MYGVQTITCKMKLFNYYATIIQSVTCFSSVRKLLVYLQSTTHELHVSNRQFRT